MSHLLLHALYVLGPWRPVKVPAPVHWVPDLIRMVK